MTRQDLLEQILVRVSKPARYIGEEINHIKKDFDSTAFKMVLSYPDLYELGMSNLGLKILYELLNRQNDMLCERVFLPSPDMIAELENHDIPLFALESKRDLKEFDVIGFTLQYELTFTNILKIMQLAKIPIRSKDRTDEHPIIIAGGPCAFHPEPLAPFIDVFVVGEAECAITEIGQKFIELKQSGLTKNEIVKGLADLDGLYVPSTYNIDEPYDKWKKVNRLAIPDMNQYAVPNRPPIPYVEAVQNYGSIEVSRGCTVGCRFCQAGMIYRPVRERSISTIVNICDELISNTGYKEISLLSLSIADYSHLSELISTLNKRYSSRGISFSFPSLRIDGFTLGMASQIKEIRKSSLTFAVEAGSEAVRDIINKRVSEDKLLDIVREITALGWKQIKLYFMIGFPQAPDYDRSEEDDIIDLIYKILDVNRKLNITVSIATFVPKPHTPFQWSRQITIDEAREKISKIRWNIKNRRVKIKWHSLESTFIEALIARGDRKIADLIEYVFHKGAILDGWHEYFNFDLWMEGIEALNIDLDHYLHKDKDVNAVLAWDHINCGVVKDFIQKEWDRSKSGQETLDCREKCIENCGVCDKEIKRKFDQDSSLNQQDMPEKNIDSVKGDSISIRLKFYKKGILRLLSHRETVNLFQQTFIRLSLPIVFSQGFNPIPKMEFSSPLAVGVESEIEYLQFKIHVPYDLSNFQERVNQLLPGGIQVIDFRSSVDPLAKLSKEIYSQVYEIYVPEDSDPDVIYRKLAELKDLSEIPCEKKNKVNGILESGLEQDQKVLTLSFKLMEGFANLFDYLGFVFQLERRELSAMKIVKKDQIFYTELKTNNTKSNII